MASTSLELRNSTLRSHQDMGENTKEEGDTRKHI